MNAWIGMPTKLCIKTKQRDSSKLTTNEEHWQGLRGLVPRAHLRGSRLLTLSSVFHHHRIPSCHDVQYVPPMDHFILLPSAWQTELALTQDFCFLGEFGWGGLLSLFLPNANYLIRMLFFPSRALCLILGFLPGGIPY